MDRTVSQGADQSQFAVPSSPFILDPQVYPARIMPTDFLMFERCVQEAQIQLCPEQS
jgi:hypothetical protein